MKALGGIGLAVAATVGGAAALSWSVWILVAFSGAPSQANEQRPAVVSESGPAARSGAAAERSRDLQGVSRVAISRRAVVEQ